MAPARRLLERRRGGDDGLTLVELLVSTILLTIVISLATGALMVAMRQNSTIGQQTQAQTRNNVSVELLTRLLRQAVYPVNGNSANASMISVASATQLQFTSRMSSTSGATADPANATVQQFLFQLSGTTLKWGTGAQNTSCAGTTTVCTYATPTLSKDLAYGVQNAAGTSVCPANTSGGAIFRYFYVGSTGSLVPWISGTNTLDQIKVVRIDLWTQTQTGARRPTCVPITDYVELRNHA